MSYSLPKPTAFVAVDLEMEQPSQEIISIGVAISDANDITQVAASANFYITPTQPLSDFIKNLTGLQESDYDNTKSREQCFTEFRQWLFRKTVMFEPCGYKLHREFVTWGCGDVTLLAPELKDTAMSSRRFIDVKTLCLMDKLYSGLSIPGKLGLSTALRERKIEPHGTAHNSESDAVNTLKLFAAVVSREQNRRKAIVTLQDFVR